MSATHRIGAAAPGYTALARALHWTTAVIVITMIPAGFFMVYGPEGGLQDVVYELHRSFGVVLLAVMLLRLVNRRRSPPPPLPADIPPLQAKMANAVHGALYVLLIVQPLIGWAATSAYPAPIHFFWLIDLPPIWPPDRGLSDQLFVAHSYLGIAIGVLASGHIAAALFHHLVRRDQVLRRMLRG